MDDWFSGLVGGVSSLAGGFLNTSSAQAINAANLQQQQWSAQGGYLPGLIGNANRAGINPLAVLGMKGPNMATNIQTDPGAGLQALGAMAPQMESFRLQRDKQAKEIESLQAGIDNTKIQIARNKQAIDYLNSHPDVMPEGVQERTFHGMGAGWLSSVLSDPNMSWGRPFNVIRDWDPHPKLSYPEKSYYGTSEMPGGYSPFNTP